MVRSDVCVASFTICTEQWRLGPPAPSPAAIEAVETQAARSRASGVAGVGLLLAAFGLMASLCLIWGNGW